MKHNGLLQGLLRSFPAPDFLTMPAVGMELTLRVVRFLELKDKAGGYSIGRYGESFLPKPLEDETFPSSEALKTLLAEVKQKYNFGFVEAALPEEKAYIFSTEVPQLSPEEIHASLELQLEEHVPVPPGEAVFDYQIINTDEATKKYLVSVSVLPHLIVSRYLDFFTSVGLQPISFQLSAQAVTNSVVSFGNDAPLILVNMGERQTGLYLVSHRTVHFTSTVAVGGEAFTEAIKKYFSVSEAEAEKIKTERGILKKKEESELFFSLANTLSVLKDEVEKLVSYWQTHLERYSNVRQKITRVVLCGSESGLQGLPEYLEANLSMPVELGNVWRNVFSFDSYIPPISRKDSLAYATATGLLLRRHD